MATPDHPSADIVITSRKRNFSTFADASTVKIEVGAPKTVFNVHKQRLVDVSPFFKAALCGSFKEAHEECISLPEDDVDIVNQFILWLYTGKVQLPPNNDITQLRDVLMIIAALYVFGDKYQVRRLKRNMLDLLYLIHRKRGYAGDFTVAEYVYSHTAGPCGMRKLLVDAFVYREKWSEQFAEQMQGWTQEIHQEYAKDLIVQFALRLSSRKTFSYWGPVLEEADLKRLYHDADSRMGEKSGDENEKTGMPGPSEIVIPEVGDERS